LDEAEEEISKEKAIKRKLQRDLEDSQEGYEAMVREVSSLKNKLSRGTGLNLTGRISKRGSLPGTGDDSTVSQEDSFDGEEEKV